MNLSRFATRNLQALVFVTAALCLVGGWSVFGFPVSILPDVTFPRIVVIAETGDRPARMMDIGVGRPLEEALTSVPGVVRVKTKAQRGAVEISVDFAWGTDMKSAQQLVNAKVGDVRGGLPTDASVTVERMNPTVFPILGVALHSKTLSQTELWSLATYTLRPRLGRVSGVARVVVQGGRVPEIVVEANPQKLQGFRLSATDVSDAIAQSNVVRAVGRLDRSYQQVQTLVSGETTNLDELKNIVVASRNGIPITVGMVASVRRGEEDRTTIVTADGSESVLLNVVRQPDANTMSVVAQTEAELKALKRTLPPGTDVSIFYDQSVLIGDAVGSVRDAVLIGAVLAVVVLLLFLGDIRATLVTAAIIPATVLITFLLMRLAGLTMNLMTLGALAIGVGLVIDDAIVVVENVFRHLAEGLAPPDAVRAASAEIAAPMISSTLTTVVVFLPLLLLQGVAGAFFTALAVTLTIALLVSLVLALLVSPSLCAAFLRARPGGETHGRLFQKLLTGYERVLRLCLAQRLLVLPIGGAAILGATAFFALQLGTGFMPAMDEGAFILDYWTPPGTSLAESDRLLKQIETILKETPDVRAFSRRTGTELGFAITEPNRGDFAVMLQDTKRRPIQTVIGEVRDKITDQVPGVDVDFIQVLQDLIGDLAGAPAPIEVKLFGENQNTLDKTARTLAESLGKVKGCADVQSGVIESGPELTVRINGPQAGRAGMTPDMAATQANAALLGTVATRITEGDRPVAVRVRYPLRFRDTKSALQNVPIKTPNGFYLPLGSLGEIATTPGTTEINRENQRRMVSVTAQLEGRDLGSVVKDVQSVLQKTALPPGVTAFVGGQYQSQNESFRNLLLVLGLAVLLVFAVMLFQFQNWTAPVTLLLIMPLSLFGVALGLWVTKTPLNVSSFMGAVMLVGIVVKNGILLLDQAQKSEQAGMTTTEAVIHAGEVRMRPILMTTLTAILGLVPLALGIGAGAEMQQPLAIAVIGGLLFSTLFTLVFAPLLYVSLRRGKIPPA